MGSEQPESVVALEEGPALRPTKSLVSQLHPRTGPQFGLGSHLFPRIVAPLFLGVEAAGIVGGLLEVPLSALWQWVSQAILPRNHHLNLGKALLS